MLPPPSVMMFISYFTSPECNSVLVYIGERKREKNNRRIEQHRNRKWQSLERVTIISTPTSPDQTHSWASVRSYRRTKNIHFVYGEENIEQNRQNL